jgi:hypothetical protein
MPLFEYKHDVNLDEPELNELGDQGWELVSVSPTGKDNTFTGFWFKREKRRS